MKGGKEEESKATGPMFPRLHVNDANRGGPRAPPRNKMALYEQFSVPSQRFNSSSSASTRPQQEGGNLVPSNSSIQQRGGVQEKPFFSSFNDRAHTSALSSDKVNCQSTGAPLTTSTRPEPERRPLKLVRREVITPSRQSTAPESSPHQTREASRREPCNKRLPPDDFMVPTFFKQADATEKVLLGQEPGGKSGNNFIPLPGLSSKTGNINNLEREKRAGKEARDREEQDAFDEGSMVDEVPGMDISPDDVVAAIGHKTFWKARRLIVNQQRVFAVQVFELHRLIKVQMLIAASPHVLLQGDSFHGKKPPPLTKPVPAIGLNLIAQPQGSKHVGEPQMIKKVPECSKETTVVHVPPPREEAHDHSQVRSVAAVNSATIPMAPPENNPSNNTWYLPPPPHNQWLVPVMSSSGLVYKPYSGPHPPPGSFMAPFFPGCIAPVPIATETGDFMNSSYSIPVPPHQNVGPMGFPNYFPPFGMHGTNENPNPNPSANPNPAVEKEPGHVEQRSHSSCNMPQLRNDAFSGCMWGFPKSKESELQGSTASSPSDKGDDAIRLFPMGPPSFQPSPSGGAGSMTRVIKVVPRNPQLATESVARIFRSIQKERKKNDT